MGSLLRSLGFAVLYVLATYAGRLTVLDETNLSLVWPAAGVLAVWFVAQRLSGRLWLDAALLVVITLVINVATGAQPAMAVFFAAANLLQAYVFLVLFRRWLPTLWVPGGETLSRPAQLWRFITAAAVSTLLGATLGTVGLVLVTGSHSVDGGLVWLARNTVSVLLVGVALHRIGWLLSDGRHRRVRAIWAGLSTARRVEYYAVMAVSVLAYGLVFGVIEGPSLAFALIGMSVWAGVRLRTTFVIVHDLVFGSVAILFTLADSGPFAAIESHAMRALVAQLFVGTVAVVGLTLALGRDERRALLVRLRASEQAAVEQATTMATIIDAMEEGLVVIDEHGHYRLRNPAAQRLIGVTSGTEQIADSSYYGLFQTDGTPLAAHDFPHHRILAGNYQPMDLMVRNASTPGGRIIHVSGAPLPVGQDRRREALVVFHDVTADRRHRDELMSFAGVVAHDLMNPLATIDGWSELLAAETDPDDEATQGILVRIRRAADRMRSLIDGLLAYTTARDAGISPAPVDLDAMVHDIAAGRLDHAASGTAPTPRFDIGDLASVSADPVLTRQLLENLVGNAIKYTAPGVAPRIVVRGEPTGDGFVRISVADNGIGIPTGQHEAIFQNFHRADNGLTYAGTGLGLAICKRIVERHGGTITAAPGDSGGSRMTFTLPLSG